VQASGLRRNASRSASSQAAQQQRQQQRADKRRSSCPLPTHLDTPRGEGLLELLCKITSDRQVRLAARQSSIVGEVAGTVA
jgi:hypothetical protein